MNIEKLLKFLILKLMLFSYISKYTEIYNEIIVSVIDNENM